MKFLLFLALAVLAVAQAVYLMSPDALPDDMAIGTVDDEGLDQADIQIEEWDIPMDAYKACNAAGCRSLCRRLGFNNGRCINANNCRCYN